MPTQPTQVPAPLQAADFNGHEMAKATPPYASLALFASAVRFERRSPGQTDSELPTTVALFTFTHAFLI